MNLRVSTHKDEHQNSSRVERLRTLTRAAHDGLDKRIMSERPFSSRERYGLFLQVQYHFHRDISALYGSPELQLIFSDLVARRRLDLIETDLADLGMSVPVSLHPPEFGFGPDTASAFGWLYVAEGSNLGAAILLKQAAKLELNTSFGARHLAGHHTQGRGLHWRTFSSALDAKELSAEDEMRVTQGGIDAFNRVRGLVEEVFG